MNLKELACRRFADLTPSDLRRLKMYGKKFKEIKGNADLSSLLQELCRTRGLSVVKILLKDCLWPSDIEDHMGNSLLHHATMGNNVGVADFLIGNGALLSNVNAANETPLHIAVLFNCKDVATLLLGKDPNLEMRSTTGLTPVCCAFVNGNVDMAKLLWQHNAKCNISFNGVTPLLLCLRNRFDNCVDFLLNEVGIDPNERVDGCNIDCLSVAVRWSLRPIIEKLLERDVDQLTVDPVGYFPIEVAAMVNRIDIVQLLMPGIPHEKRFTADWSAKAIALHCAGVNYKQTVLWSLNSQIKRVVECEEHGDYKAAFDLYQHVDMLYKLKFYHYGKMSLFAQKLKDLYRARTISIYGIVLANSMLDNDPQKKETLAEAFYTLGTVEEQLMDSKSALETYKRASQLVPNNVIYEEKVRHLGG